MPTGDIEKLLEDDEAARDSGLKSRDQSDKSINTNEENKDILCESMSSKSKYLSKLPSFGKGKKKKKGHARSLSLGNKKEIKDKFEEPSLDTSVISLPSNTNNTNLSVSISPPTPDKG